MEPEPAVRRRNGRKYLVEQQLPKLERVDSSLWNTIVGGLFDANDRISESAVVGPLRSKLIIATRAEGSQLSVNLPRWTIHATQVLSNLAVDIELLKNKLIRHPWSDWNKDILKDCLQLINFLLWRFLNWEHTEPLLSQCRAKALDLVEIREGGGRTFNELADSLEQSLKCTRNKLESLLSCKKDHRKELQRLMGEGSDGTHGTDPKISTATLRELLVRNEAHRLRSQITNDLKSTPPRTSDVRPSLGGGVLEATRTGMRHLN
jgi:hypothetical protein